MLDRISSRLKLDTVRAVADDVGAAGSFLGIRAGTGAEGAARP